MHFPARACASHVQTGSIVFNRQKKGDSCDVHKFLKCDVHKSYYFFQSSVTSRLQTRLDSDPITISLVGILLPMGTEQFSFLSCLHKVQKLLKKMSTVLGP